MKKKNGNETVAASARIRKQNERKEKKTNGGACPVVDGGMKSHGHAILYAVHCNTNG